MGTWPAGSGRHGQGFVEFLSLVLFYSLPASAASNAPRHRAPAKAVSAGSAPPALIHHKTRVSPVMGIQGLWLGPRPPAIQRSSATLGLDTCTFSPSTLASRYLPLTLSSRKTMGESGLDLNCVASAQKRFNLYTTANSLAENDSFILVESAPCSRRDSLSVLVLLLWPASMTLVLTPVASWR